MPNIEQEVWLMKADHPHRAAAFQGKRQSLSCCCSGRAIPTISQHNTKDSVGEYEPGINGPSGKAGTRDADTMLGELLAALKEQGLDKTTDIFVTADHGFLTVSHASATSPRRDPATRRRSANGFLAIDLASALQLRLFDPAAISPRGLQQRRQAGRRRGPAGRSADPDVVVTPNGGADLIYLPGANAKDAGRRHRQFPDQPGLCQRRVRQ